MDNNNRITQTNNYIKTYFKQSTTKRNSAPFFPSSTKILMTTPKQGKLLLAFQPSTKRSCDVSTIDSGTIRSFPCNSDIKIIKVINKRNRILTHKIESTLETINKNQNAVLKHQLNTKRELKREKENISTRNAFKQLKRKINKLISSNPLIVCHDFQRSNTMYNDKFLYHLNGPTYYTQAKQYHRNFHFHSNDLSEAHNKFNMIVDFDKFKQGLLFPHQILRENLTKEDIELIKHDPSYFLKSDELIRQKEYKIKSLSNRINEEEVQETLPKNIQVQNKSHRKRIQLRKIKLQTNEDNTKAAQSSHNKAFDPIFNWTDFDLKIAEALNGLNKRLNKANSMKELKKSPHPEYPVKLQNEINKELTSIFKYKRKKALHINFNNHLPVNQQRDYLNYALKKRIEHAKKKYIERQESLIVKSNDDYTFRKTLGTIRDNIIHNKKFLLPSCPIADYNLNKSGSTKSI